MLLLPKTVFALLAGSFFMAIANNRYCLKTQDISVLFYRPDKVLVLFLIIVARQLN